VVAFLTKLFMTVLFVFFLHFLIHISYSNQFQKQWNNHRMLSLTPEAARACCMIWECRGLFWRFSDLRRRFSRNVFSSLLRKCPEERGHAQRNGDGFGDSWKDQDTFIMFLLLEGCG